MAGIEMHIACQRQNGIRCHAPRRPDRIGHCGGIRLRPCRRCVERHKSPSAGGRLASAAASRTRVTRSSRPLTDAVIPMICAPLATKILPAALGNDAGIIGAAAE